MRTHLHTQVNRKVSRFIMGEEGKVGSQSAFTAAAFIGATSLAGILIGAPDVSANNCGGGANCNADSPWCCLGPGGYDCEPMDETDIPAGISCWQVA